MFDLLIIGGGPSAVSCALILGSAASKPYMENKKIGMIAFQKTADLNGAVLNNLLGVAKGTKGTDLMTTAWEQVSSFSSIEQLAQEPVTSILSKEGYYEIKTEENTYKASQVVVAIGHHPRVAKIEGLETYVIPHEKSLPGISKSALRNENLVVKEGLYVAGLLSGCASQVAIAIGEGADVAVQLLTKWNGGEFDHYHDK